MNDSLTIGLLQQRLLTCLAPGTWVLAVKSNNFVAGTLQAYISRPRNNIPVRQSQSSM